MNGAVGDVKRPGGWGADRAFKNGCGVRKTRVPQDRTLVKNHRVRTPVVRFDSPAAITAAATRIAIRDRALGQPLDAALRDHFRWWSSVRCDENEVRFWFGAFVAAWLKLDAICKEVADK